MLIVISKLWYELEINKEFGFLLICLFFVDLFFCCLLKILNENEKRLFVG